MPKPHLPVRGGTHPQAQYGQTAAREANSPCERCRELSTELDRLQQELSRQTSGARPGTLTGTGTVWGALLLCGMGLLFALMAVMRHG